MRLKDAITRIFHARSPEDSGFIQAGGRVAENADQAVSDGESLVEKAQTSIHSELGGRLTGIIGNEKLLSAIEEARQRGVEIEIVLGADANPELIGLLVDHGILVHKAPKGEKVGSFMIFDEKKLMIPGKEGTFYTLESRGHARSLEDDFNRLRGQSTLIAEA